MQLVEKNIATTVCHVGDLVADSGICVLVEGRQIALFYLPKTEHKIFAVDNWDPIGKANVLSRGIVGSIGEQLVVASPLYKQHFDLQTGACIEDMEFSIATYSVLIVNDSVLVELP